jgi:hypothetical protein
MNTYWWVEVQLRVFLTSELKVGKWQASLLPYKHTIKHFLFSINWCNNNWYKLWYYEFHLLSPEPFSVLRVTERYAETDVSGHLPRITLTNSQSYEVRNLHSYNLLTLDNSLLWFVKTAWWQWNISNLRTISMYRVKLKDTSVTENIWGYVWHLRCYRNSVSVIIN